MAAYIRQADQVTLILSKSEADALRLFAEGAFDGELDVWPLPNVWLGVSAEDQQRADDRIPYLLDTPAAVRFVSSEPLLGPIDLHVPYAGAKVCGPCETPAVREDT